MHKFLFYLLLAAVLVVGGIVVGLSISPNKFQLTDHQVQSLVFATIQAEADTTVLVTGYYDLDVTTRVQDNKALWGISLGTTEVNVRVPGRVSYGFNMGQFSTNDIRIAGNEVIVTIPPPEIWSVEPHLDQMQMQTEVGWARLQAYSGRALEQLAIRRLPEEFRRVASERMKSNNQPMKNTELALRKTLAPVLKSVGIENPVFVIQAKNPQQLPTKG